MKVRVYLEKIVLGENTDGLHKDYEANFWLHHGDVLVVIMRETNDHGTSERAVASFASGAWQRVEFVTDSE